jgi:hypothetical protein
MKLREAVALVSLVAAASALLMTRPVAATSNWVEPGEWLHTVDHALADVGIRQRRDIKIHLSGNEVAHGYSRTGCPGLLLVAPLPETAQGWGHVAPAVDLSRFHVSYIFKGTVHDSVPLLSRLRNSLIADLIGLPDEHNLVVALAEAGDCRLAADATTAIRLVTLGQHGARSS